MTYLLIPGAGGAGWYWHRLETELRSRGHDTIAVDLPADDERAGLAEYVDTVVDAAGTATGVVVVAQSMGAFVAPQVCERLGASLLVLVNAMVPAPGETPDDWWANTGQREAMREMDLREGRDPDAAFDVFTTFLHDVDPRVAESGAEHQRDQSNTPVEQPWPLAAWPEVPIRAVIGRDDRLFPAEFQRRLLEERLGIAPDELPGGHLVALVSPVELADLLERYVTDVTRNTD
jgi:pimeloyl-ACP methyl ester carboxylesterase